MKNHKVIDTSQFKGNKFVFSGLTEKTKNALIAGGLSFAGIAAAVGIHRLFQSEGTIKPSADSTTSDTSEDMSSPTDENREEYITNEASEETSLSEELPIEEAYSNDMAAELEESEYTITFDTGANFASTADDNMDFPSAFAQARQEVGMGGFFNWRSNSYSTYTREEWEAMSYEDQQRFFEDVSSQTQLDINSWAIETVEMNKNAAIIQDDSLGEDIVYIEEGEIEIYEDESYLSAQKATTNVVVEGDVETITIVPAATYGSADMNADHIVDAIAIDTNNDGKVDLLAMDENYDGTYEAFQINEDGDDDLDVFIIDQGGDGIDDTDEIQEISDVVDMEDFIIIDADDEALEGLDFIDELIDIEGEEGEEDTDDSNEDLGFEDPGL